MGIKSYLWESMGTELKLKFSANGPNTGHRPKIGLVPAKILTGTKISVLIPARFWILVQK